MVPSQVTSSLASETPSPNVSTHDRAVLVLVLTDGIRTICNNSAIVFAARFDENSASHAVQWFVGKQRIKRFDKSWAVSPHCPLVYRLVLPHDMVKLTLMKWREKVFVK